MSKCTSPVYRRKIFNILEMLLFSISKKINLKNKKNRAAEQSFELQFKAEPHRMALYNEEGKIGVMI